MWSTAEDEGDFLRIPIPLAHQIWNPEILIKSSLSGFKIIKPRLSRKWVVEALPIILRKPSFIADYGKSRKFSSYLPELHEPIFGTHKPSPSGLRSIKKFQTEQGGHTGNHLGSWSPFHRGCNFLPGKEMERLTLAILPQERAHFPLNLLKKSFGPHSNVYRDGLQHSLDEGNPPGGCQPSTHLGDHPKRQADAWAKPWNQIWHEPAPSTKESCN